MAVRLHPHAEERLDERGATRDEVIETVERGEQFPAKFDRIGFRRNFVFDSEWRGKHYRNKQVLAYVARESDDWVVVTVITKFF